jgi:hypothetical protein
MGSFMRISVERLRKLLYYNPITGLFVWAVRNSNRAPVGSVAGTVSKRGCLDISIDGQRYKAHHLAWLYFYGEWPAQLVDHRDTNPLNNKIVNLRLATKAQNGANSRFGARPPKALAFAIVVGCGDR